jgi:tetratricopeptide (TPR) repeat protein
MTVVDNLGGLLAVMAAVAALLLLVYFLGYQLRLGRVTESLVDAEEALDTGDVVRARDLVAPILAKYPQLSVVQDVAADVLYANGDPLSAASLYERAMKKLGAARVAPKLVAAYAALNRAGDARRVAALAPADPMTRLALAWSELAAVGGDRQKGRALADDLLGDTELRSTPAGDAMASVLEAIAAARAGETTRARAALDRASGRRAELAAHDSAFIGYLGGIAFVEMGAIADARATWTRAVDAAPETIGSALARRERSHLPAE